MSNVMRGQGRRLLKVSDQSTSVEKGVEALDSLRRSLFVHSL
jgi:hypothetical protein